MKYSIRRRISECFILLLISSFVTWCVMNSLFLESFYSSMKSKSLTVIYDYINTLDNSDLEEENITLKINKLCEDSNVDLIVMNSSLEISYASMNNTTDMQNILFNYIFSQGENDNTIQKMTDKRNDSEYYVMWGYLHNGNFYVMRTAVQSIIDSVRISNKFMIYVGLIITSLGSVVASVISSKITEPIRELTKISDKMIHLDFNAKYTGDSKDEIGILGERMNNLSETLEDTISELKTANNELKQDIKKKEEIDEMRQEFISNVSHELKTPISLIQGYAEGLKECINDDAESRDFYCDVIMDEAAKMNKMVKSLLTLTELEFGRDNITLECVDLYVLVKNIVSSTSILAKSSNVDVRFKLKPDVYVWADEYKLEEVVTNYVSNAFHYVTGDNIIEISMDEHKDESNPDKTLVRVKVFNSGNPIPEEDIDKIWVKFYKVDKARTREYGGSGIGLSIVKAIMEAHHQKCGVDNYDNGVCFWFEMEKCGRNHEDV